MARIRATSATLGSLALVARICARDSCGGNMDGIDGTLERAPVSPFRERTENYSLLRGDDAPLPKRGPFALIEALLKQPANVMHEVRERASMNVKLVAISLATMMLVGLI